MSRLLNLLVSRPYMNDALIAFWVRHQGIIRMVVDSGAFTNWKAGRETGSVDEYMRFIEGLPVAPWRYFTLDRIGDPETTASNYQTMLNHGFNPVPIFTRGTPIKQIDALYDQSDLVGVGVGVGSNNYRGYLRWVVERNKGRPLHWLGVAIPGMIARFQPYSCDASTWENGGRYGSIQVYQGGGAFKTYRRQHANTRPPNPNMWKLIRSLGYDPRELQHEASWRGGESVSRLLGCASWVRYMIDVEERFKTRIFLALASPRAIRQCVDEYIRAGI